MNVHRLNSFKSTLPTPGFVIAKILRLAAMFDGMANSSGDHDHDTSTHKKTYTFLCECSY